MENKMKLPRLQEQEHKTRDQQPGRHLNWLKAMSMHQGQVHLHLQNNQMTQHQHAIHARGLGIWWRAAQISYAIIVMSTDITMFVCYPYKSQENQTSDDPLPAETGHCTQDPRREIQNNRIPKVKIENSDQAK